MTASEPEPAGSENRLGMIARGSLRTTEPRAMLRKSKPRSLSSYFAKEPRASSSA